MFINHVNNIEKITMNAPGVNGATKQTLIGPAQGWEGWVMRQFSLAGGGHTPRHSHPWPHINYVLSGKGVLFLGGQEHTLEPGSVAYVPGDVEHQFMNKEEQELSFICIVPEEGDK
ncbi:cupin domain-containing protein [Desulforamulus aeronauticus]|uniref:Cupin domain-containing protein n=1 Tax=Desulforamulus aeronauticus DSM 10349 TaxID=1121421 RepID=A0A1M6VYK2_9FIRM|nr:cupin domain-containing protein [Desulforamulus aeronauticus]SHK86527.1 Cupin domain-containing protein [Desulforamulus aeronauticus DSM 10349]